MTSRADPGCCGPHDFKIAWAAAANAPGPPIYFLDWEVDRSAEGTHCRGSDDFVWDTTTYVPNTAIRFPNQEADGGAWALSTMPQMKSRSSLLPKLGSEWGHTASHFS